MFWQPQQTHSCCSLTENFLCSLSVLTRSTHGPDGETKPGLRLSAVELLTPCTLDVASSGTHEGGHHSSWKLVHWCEAISLWDHVCGKIFVQILLQRGPSGTLMTTEWVRKAWEWWVKRSRWQSFGGDGGGFLFLLYTVEKKCFWDEPGYLKELKPTSWRVPWVAIKYLWSWTSEVPLCYLWQITSLVFICQRVFINSTHLKGIYED